MTFDQLTQALRSACADLDITIDQIEWEFPREPKFGDISTNIALKSSSKEYRSPRQRAQLIIDHLPPMEQIAKIEIAGPGFINFFYADSYLMRSLSAIIKQNRDYGKSDKLMSKRITIEFTDPNPFKEFHVGHLYSNTVGESIARLLEFQSAQVCRVDYFGDVGMHVAKTLWGLNQLFIEQNTTLHQIAELPLNERVGYLGQAYARGATAYNDSDSAKPEMQAINTLVFKVAQEHILPQFQQKPNVKYENMSNTSPLSLDTITEWYLQGRAWSLEYFETIYKRLGTKFDYYYPESYVGEIGYQIVQDNLGTVFQTGEDGAIIYPGSRFQLHDRVFINSLGLPTYEAKELGLAPAKYRDAKYDTSIIVTGNEINEYFKVLLSALEHTHKDLRAKTVHIGHGMVRLPEGKMSSRTGKIIQGEWLVNTAKAKVRKIMADTPDLPPAEKDNIAEIVAIGAIKYAFLKQNIGENISFDFDTSLAFSGNSGPYIQYTYTRCKSVINQAQTHIDFAIDDIVPNSEERQLLVSLQRFPQVVDHAGQYLAPHSLCTYLYHLAQEYNVFYTRHSILKADTPQSIKFRLLLTHTTAIVIKNGLTILGIKVPPQM